MKKLFMFHLPEGKRAAVKAIGSELGAEIYDMKGIREGMTVDELICNSSGDSMDENNASASKYTMELLIMSGLSGREMDILLDKYKRTGQQPVQLKAVVTSSNRSWTLDRLYLELAKEYLIIKMRGK